MGMSHQAMDVYNKNLDDICDCKDEQGNKKNK